jgi:hypothetical protein
MEEFAPNIYYIVWFDYWFYWPFYIPGKLLLLIDVWLMFDEFRKKPLVSLVRFSSVPLIALFDAFYDPN